MRKVFILPNLFTAGSLFSGLLVIFYVLDWAGEADLEHVFWLLLLAGLLDITDGLIARLTNTQSAFGLNFDSIADVVVFGVAPALLAYTFTAPAFAGIARATCGLYVVCGAMRLARYNVQAAREESKAFTGLPIPAAAAVVGGAVWVLTKRAEVAAFLPPERILPPLMVLVAYLMVSKFPYGGLKAALDFRSQPFEILVTSVVLIIVLFVLKDIFDIIGFTAFFIYMLTGPIFYYRRKYRAARARARARSGGEEPPETVQPSTHSRGGQ